MKNISIQYFAMLREQSGKDREEYQTHSKTYNDLYSELISKYDFDLPISMIQVAINDEYSSVDKEIRDGDKVVFIPPVAGG